MAPTLTLATDARRIGEHLVEEFHQHLTNATILYLFTDQKRKSKGRIVLGTAKKTSPMEQFLSQAYSDGEGADFVMLLGIEEYHQLTPEQRIALVDHELCHMTVTYNEDTDEPAWAIRGHDVEEFAEIIERHGLWEPSLQQFAAAFEQLRLPMAVEA